MRDDPHPARSIPDHLHADEAARVSELRADLTLLQNQLYGPGYGPGGESLFVRLRLQEELQQELKAWKKTLITRFWQVVLAIITTMTIATTTVWWDHSAKILRLEQQSAGLEQRLP